MRNKYKFTGWCLFETPTTTNDASVECCIHLRRGAGLRQLQSLLYRSHAWLALSHTAPLQQLRGVRALTERERLLSLSHLDAEVVGERAEIAHSKMSRHLALEAIDVLHTRVGDDQVVHIHADDELLLPPGSELELC